MVRPVLNPETMEIQLLCPDGEAAVLEDGIAICPRCGACVTLEDIDEALHRCKTSLERLIENVESVRGAVPPPYG